jgi:hypothetical protein
MSTNLPEFSAAANSLKRGLYRHFKGGEYEVIGVGRSSIDAAEELVIYRNIGTDELWIRPLVDFLAIVERDGYTGPRFTYVR